MGTPADAADLRTMRERMLAGDLYIADDPELGEASTRALDLADAYNATTVRQGPLRRRLLEELLGTTAAPSASAPAASPTSAWSRWTSRPSPSGTTSRSGPTSSC
jgi:maltose O-acetyltransferase